MLMLMMMMMINGLPLKQDIHIDIIIVEEQRAGREKRALDFYLEIRFECKIKATI